MEGVLSAWIPDKIFNRYDLSFHLSKTEARIYDIERGQQMWGQQMWWRFPSHWGMWPLGLHRMDLSGCRDAIVWSYLGVLTSGLCDRQGAVTISPLGLHGRHDKTSRKQNWRPHQECKWMRPHDSKSDKDEKKEKKNKNGIMFPHWLIMYGHDFNKKWTIKCIYTM